MRAVIKYTFSIFLISITLFSCTEVIDLNFTTDFERLVVDASIMDEDTTQYVNLSKINVEQNGEIVSPISGANVIVSSQESDIVFTESDTLAGFYVAPKGFMGELGSVYTLKISNTGVIGTDGSDYYEASAEMPRKLLIDSVKADYLYVPQFGINGHMLSCWAWDPPEVNYYLFKAWRNGVLLTDSLFEYEQTDDFIFNGNYINGANCQLLSIDKPDERVEVGDTLHLEIDNIDKAYYDYLNSAQNEYWGSNPLFGGPPVNVTSNITNGAVGIYRVYSPSKKSTIAGAFERIENNNF